MSTKRGWMIMRLMFCVGLLAISSTHQLQAAQTYSPQEVEKMTNEIIFDVAKSRLTNCVRLATEQLANNSNENAEVAAKGLAFICSKDITEFVVAYNLHKDKKDSIMTDKAIRDGLVTATVGRIVAMRAQRSNKENQ